MRRLPVVIDFNDLTEKSPRGQPASAGLAEIADRRINCLSVIGAILLRLQLGLAHAYNRRPRNEFVSAES